MTGGPLLSKSMTLKLDKLYYCLISTPSKNMECVQLVDSSMYLFFINIYIGHFLVLSIHTN